MKNTMVLTKWERMELTRRVRSRTGRAETARRARVILLLAEGATWATVCHTLGCSRGFVATWSQRFAAERLAGLYSRHHGQIPLRHTPQTEARILEATRRRRPTAQRTGAPASWQPSSGATI